MTDGDRFVTPAPKRKAALEGRSLLEQVMGRAVAICDCSLGGFATANHRLRCVYSFAICFYRFDFAVVYSYFDGRGSFRYTRLKIPPRVRGGILEQVMGVEPTSKAWEAFILPMNYTCIFGLCLRSARTVTDFAGVA